MRTTDFVATLFDDATGQHNKIVIALTMAFNAAEKGHSSTLILMGDAVLLGTPKAMNPIDIGAPFKSASELLEAYLKLDGRVAVCKSCMVNKGISEDQIDPRYVCITGADVIDLTMNATGTLQIA